MSKPKHDDDTNDDSQRRGKAAPNPMKSDVGRTDDVPRETAQGGIMPEGNAQKGTF